MHQDDKPQPGGLRHQDGSGGGRDQPVEQDEPAVRYGCDRPCQPGQGGGIGLGPRAGHDELRHVPARGDEFVADPPVIPVAAARPGLVVDAVGDHDVDGRHETATEIRPLARADCEDARCVSRHRPYLPTLELNRIVVRTYGTEVPR